MPLACLLTQLAIVEKLRTIQLEQAERAMLEQQLLETRCALILDYQRKQALAAAVAAAFVSMPPAPPGLGHGVPPPPPPGLENCGLARGSPMQQRACTAPRLDQGTAAARSFGMKSAPAMLLKPTAASGSPGSRKASKSLHSAVGRLAAAGDLSAQGHLINEHKDEEQSSTAPGESDHITESEPEVDDDADESPSVNVVPGGPLTTLMVRNVPVMYTQEMLVEEWPNNGTYDFLYLPFSCLSQRNLSYAFINFTTEAHAVAFRDKWQKQRLARFSSRKPLNISFADVQGRESNLIQLKKKRVRRIKVLQCQPVLFDNSGRIPLQTVL